MRNVGSIPGWGTKILHAAGYGQKKKTQENKTNNANNKQTNKQTPGAMRGLTGCFLLGNTCHLLEAIGGHPQPGYFPGIGPNKPFPSFSKPSTPRLTFFQVMFQTGVLCHCYTLTLQRQMALAMLICNKKN